MNVSEAAIKAAAVLRTRSGHADLRKFLLTGSSEDHHHLRCDLEDLLNTVDSSYEERNR